MTTFVVNDRGDAVDGNDATLTLREALAKAAQHAGADTITFAASVFTPGSPDADRTIHLTQGELAITQAGGALTVDGDVNADGVADVVINADRHSRVLEVSGTAAAAASVAIDGLVITGGRLAGDTDSGGGIRAEHAALVLTNTTITDNLIDAPSDGAAQQGKSGGGLYLVSSSLRGDGVTIDHNQIHSHGVASGGAIAADGAIVNAARITVQGSSARGNYGTGFGGGLYLHDSTSSIVQSLIDDNDTAVGGGIDASGGRLEIQGQRSGTTRGSAATRTTGR